jgi:hypothetical protein
MPDAVSTYVEVAVNSHPVGLSSWNARGDLPSTTDSLGLQWSRDGWMPFDGGRDFAPDLLGIAPQDQEGREALQSGCRVLLFQRNDDYRLLALLRLPGGCFTVLKADVPLLALTDTATDLPVGVQGSQVVRIQGMEAWVWHSSHPVAESDSISTWALRQGWSWNHWKNQGADRLFLARKGSVSCLVTLSPTPEGSTATWLFFRSEETHGFHGDIPLRTAIRTQLEDAT